MAQLEIVCTNPNCRSTVPLGPGEMFQHWMLASASLNNLQVKGIGDAPCPACDDMATQTKRVFFDAPTHRIALGVTVATPGADDLLRKHFTTEHAIRQGMRALCRRHASGDWGAFLDNEDRQANENAIGKESEPENRQRILAVHELAGQRVWLITEAGRHNTTLLLPDEY